MSNEVEFRFSSPSNNQTIIYDETLQKWVNSPYTGSTIRQALTNKFYVDNVAGDDTNDGLTPSTPLASMSEAVSRSPDKLLVYLSPSTTAYTINPNSMNNGYNLCVFNKNWGVSDGRTSIVESDNIETISFVTDLYTTNPRAILKLKPSTLTVSASNCKYYIKFTSGTYSGYIAQIAGYDTTNNHYLVLAGYLPTAGDSFNIIKYDTTLTLTSPSYPLASSNITCFGINVNISTLYATHSNISCSSCCIDLSSGGLECSFSNVSLINCCVYNTQAYFINGPNNYEVNNNFQAINTSMTHTSLTSSYTINRMNALLQGCTSFNANGLVSWLGKFTFKNSYFFHPIAFYDSEVNFSSFEQLMYDTVGANSTNVFENSRVIFDGCLFQKNFTGDAVDQFKFTGSNILINGYNYFNNYQTTASTIIQKDSHLTIAPSSQLSFCNNTTMLTCFDLYGNSSVSNHFIIDNTHTTTCIYGMRIRDSATFYNATTALFNYFYSGTTTLIYDVNQTKNIPYTTMNTIPYPNIVRANDENRKVKIITSDTTLTDAMSKIIANSGTSTVTLPTITTGFIGKTYTVKNNSGGSLAVNVANASTTIMDTSSTLVSSLSMISGSSATFVNSGTYWEVC